MNKIHKRTVCFMLKRIFCIMLALFFAFPLFGCKDKEPTKTRLSTINYDDYLSVNITYDSISHTLIGYEDDKPFYSLSIIGHIRTQPKRKNYTFEDVTIEWQYIFSYVSTTKSLRFPIGATNINYEGESQTSFYLSDDKFTNLLYSYLEYPQLNPKFLKVKSITGYVIEN